MTKRFLIIVLAFILIFSTVGCGSDKKVNTTETGTTASQTDENENLDGETEGVLDETLIGDETETTDSNVASDTIKAENEKVEGNDKKEPNNKTDSIPDSTTKKPITQTTTPTTDTTKPEGDNDKDTNSDSQSTNSTKVPSVKEIKLVERKIANPYILKDGKDLVARLYNTKTIQTGDKLIFSVTLENAKLSDCVIKTPGGTYEVVGNQVEITANGKRDGLWLHIELPGYNSNTPNLKATTETYPVIRYSGNLIDIIELEIKAYAERKGIRYCNGTDVWGYIWNPITKESDVNLSITKNISRGCDTIMIEGNENWVDDCINLIDKYKEIGIVQMFMEKQQKFMAFEADTAESIKYWENQ